MKLLIHQRSGDNNYVSIGIRARYYHAIILIEKVPFLY